MRTVTATALHAGRRPPPAPRQFAERRSRTARQRSTSRSYASPAAAPSPCPQRLDALGHVRRRVVVLADRRPAARAPGRRSPARPASAGGTPPASAPRPPARRSAAPRPWRPAASAAPAPPAAAPAPSACGSAAAAPASPGPPFSYSRSSSATSTNQCSGTCQVAVRIHGRASGLRSRQRSWSAAAWRRTTGGSTASSTGAGSSLAELAPAPASRAAGCARGRRSVTPSDLGDERVARSRAPAPRPAGWAPGRPASGAARPGADGRLGGARA